MFLDNPAGALAGAVFTALLAIVARSDVRDRRVPNALVVALIAGGLVTTLTVLREPVGLRGAAGGFALGLAMWAPFWLLRVLGAGDVKLAAAIGTWLGPAGVIQASVLAALVGGVLAVAVLARRRRLAALAGVVAIWASALQRGELTKPLADDKSDLLPYGVALTAGATLVAWLPVRWLTL
jgi:prepilin peptidase CpaA